MGKRIDLTGQQFGKLTVLEKAGTMKGKTYWFCECECSTWALCSTSNLRNGNSKSCGCMTHINAGKAVQKHGHTGKNSSPTYISWLHLDKNDIPEVWNDFSVFLIDAGERPSLEHRLAKFDYREPHGPNNTYWRNANDERQNYYKEPPCINLRAIIRAEIAARKGEEAAGGLSRTQTA